jgi:hypothetical protein
MALLFIGVNGLYNNGMIAFYNALNLMINFIKGNGYAGRVMYYFGFKVNCQIKSEFDLMECG